MLDEEEDPQEMLMKEIKREISMKEFLREYRKFKRMQNSVKIIYSNHGHKAQARTPPLVRLGPAHVVAL